MDEKNVLSPEEQKAEQEALAEAKTDEVRAAVISEFGFNEIDDAERIEKLVERELKNRKVVSQAIGQKIKYRTEATELRARVIPPTPAKSQVDAEEFDKKLDAKLTATLEKRDLDALDYPDDLKAEIKKVSSTQRVSVKQAIADPYIQFKVDAYEKAAKADEASVSRKNRSSDKVTYSADNPPDVDMSTKEGRDEWEKYKTSLKKQGQ
jgi:hypothetical protein